MIQKCVFFRLQKTPGFQATTWPRAWLVKTWWELTKTLRAETSTTAPRSAATCVNEGAMSRSVGCLQVTGNTADPIWAPASLRFTQPPTALEFHRSGQQLCKGDSAGTRLCSSCRCCCAVPCRAALRQQSWVGQYWPSLVLHRTRLLTPLNEKTKTLLLKTLRKIARIFLSVTDK